MRNHYWTTGPFADWLRGTKSPKYETSEGWRAWRRLAKTAHPFRYWLADEGLRYLQNFFMWPTDKLYAIKYYINNRWITKTHCLTAHPSDIPRGEWRDVGGRFLPCMFNELRDFVEVELAWWNIAWSSKEEHKKYNVPWWAYGWFRWRTWRCRQSGLDNLTWQMDLTNKDYCPEDSPDYGKPSPQAISAKEIYDLYMWWTEERPKRPEPMDVSGWSAYCESKWNRKQSIFDRDDFDEMLEPDEKVDTSAMLDQMNKLEAEYEKEDEEMLIRLIKIRNALWT